MRIQKIKVGLASCGIAAGGNEVYHTIEQWLQENPEYHIELIPTGCLGLCYSEVNVEIDTDTEKHLYQSVTSKNITEILASYKTGELIKKNLIINTKEAIIKDDIFHTQYRIVLRNCGLINPESIDDYENHNGYVSLKKLLNQMSPADVIEEVKESGLRGRGGAGFPTGKKWEFVYSANGNPKYLICNADEGDPGAFMDRSVLEGDPHSVLEGMIIAGYAIGASKGYIYIRAEYPLAIKRLETAIKQSYKKGYLGKNILGTDYNFDIVLKPGAGAFVCGEETALMASIEGKRGMPRRRPPFPAISGLWRQPTNINNVETYANIPYIFLKGGKKLSSIGFKDSKMTKVFALAGKIKKGGLIEVPMGTTIREIIFDIGGGIKNDKKIKAVQLGGPSGGCLPYELFDTQVGYSTLQASGAIVGSGGMIVLDEDDCMVDIAKYFLQFTQNESCGKCTFCRIGTKRMLEILTKITEGKAEESDLDKLLDLALNIKNGSLCGLGQTAPNPVLTTIRYFKDEYLEHIIEKKCRAKKCKDLIQYYIVPDKCTGCTACSKVCPSNCISGEKKKLHIIEQSECIKCGECYNTCNFDAIIKQNRENIRLEMTEK